MLFKCLNTHSSRPSNHGHFLVEANNLALFYINPNDVGCQINGQYQPQERDELSAILDLVL